MGNGEDGLELFMVAMGEVVLTEMLTGIDFLLILFPQ